MFQVFHTIDETGARCANVEGWLVAQVESQSTAERLAATLPGGYVRRDDGAILAPAGEWISRSTGREV